MTGVYLTSTLPVFYTAKLTSPLRKLTVAPLIVARQLLSHSSFRLCLYFIRQNRLDFAASQATVALLIVVHQLLFHSALDFACILYGKFEPSPLLTCG